MTRRTTGYPLIYNIEAEPREEHNVAATSGWVLSQYMPYVIAYQRSLEQHPNPPGVSFTEM